MNVIARTNRLHQLVKHHIQLMVQSESQFKLLKPSCVLLLEQWLLALMIEADESLKQLNLEALQDAIDLTADSKNNNFVQQICDHLIETGHWLSDVRLERLTYLDVKPPTNNGNLITSTQSKDPIYTWVAELEILMNSIREYNQEY